MRLYEQSDKTNEEDRELLKEIGRKYRAELKKSSKYRPLLRLHSYKDFKDVIELRFGSIGSTRRLLPEEGGKSYAQISKKLTIKTTTVKGI